MEADFGETVALRALGWLLEQDDLRGVFLGSTGAGAEDFTGPIAPELLVAVLDFICMDDAWLIAFCEAAGYEFTVPNAARAALPGGAVPDWT